MVHQFSLYFFFFHAPLVKSFRGFCYRADLPFPGSHTGHHLVVEAELDAEGKM